ncbi:MAG: hypothetical protein KatS3mg005_1276 [Bryobacteraceae bacterium]|nr:MAG: hypothetical protein KatS3mg005_1276 [Bryobacteraceae bacterium]
MVSTIAYQRNATGLRRFRLTAAIRLLVILAASAHWTNAKEWYVAPDGTAGGDGSKERPWSLEAALKPHPMIQPMDTVWVRKGIYNGAFVGRLKGTPGKPVVLRAYPGERVVLDGRGFSPNSVLTIEGEWAWYWGLEVTNSNPNRVSSLPGSNHPEDRGAGINVTGPNTKVINCIVHDSGNGIGTWSGAFDSEIYGAILFNNGWRAPDRRHGHSIYAQNEKGQKTIRDCIFFSPFSFNLSIYGSRRAFLNNFQLEGNIAFNGRWLVGGEGPMKRIVMRDNFLYGNSAQLNYWNRPNEGLVLEGNYLPGVTSALYWDRMDVRNNTFVRPGQQGERITVSFWTPDGFQNSVFEGNTYYVLDPRVQVLRLARVDGPEVSDYTFERLQKELGFEKTGKVITTPQGRPPEVAVFVRRNYYEPNRAHVVIYNWPKRDEVEVNISAMNPQPGDRWVLRNVQNYFEEFISGVYDGKPLRVRMTGWTASPPIGEDEPLYPVTFPEFGVFVLTLEKGSGQKTVLAADPARAGVGAPGALLRTELPEGFFRGAPVAGTVPFGEELAGIRVHVTDGEGGLWWARVVLVDSEKVVWEAPRECGLGLARVRLIREGEPEVDAGVVLIEAAAPALFTMEGSGKGAVLGWVRYRDGTIEALAECGSAGCMAKSVDGARAEELGLMGSGFGVSGGVWARIGETEGEVRGVERAEYPGVEWVRVGWSGDVAPGMKIIRAGVHSKEGNTPHLIVR